MNITKLASTGLLGLSLSAASLPALAAPQIATGDRWLEGVDQNQCLRRADNFIAELGISSDGGDIDRTGYFDDGTFRILCYGASGDSMVIVFAAHEDDIEVATGFANFALESIGDY
ncbi:MAG: hypothetical protein O3A14_16880 [Cyanobacteria bacterium]|nr:hypothetical protein [Cyanobacteriota bacterium]